MESIKTDLLEHLRHKYGPDCRAELETKGGLCIKIYIKKHPQYIIYIRENSACSEVHCYYIHRSDLTAVKCKHLEIQSYREQSIHQLFRRYNGRDFVDIGKVYIADAVWRMDGFSAMGGLRKPARTTETFESMAWLIDTFQEPKMPAEKTEDDLQDDRKRKRVETWKKNQQPLTDLQKRVRMYLQLRLKRGAKGAKKRVV